AQQEDPRLQYRPPGLSGAARSTTPEELPAPGSSSGGLRKSEFFQTLKSPGLSDGRVWHRSCDAPPSSYEPLESESDSDSPTGWTREVPDEPTPERFERLRVSCADAERPTRDRPGACALPAPSPQCVVATAAGPERDPYDPAPADPTLRPRRLR